METQPAVQVANGVFSIALGGVTPLIPANFTGAPIYLGVSVNGETELPRTRLLASPFAIRAAEADHALTADIASDGVWSVNGANVYRLGGSVCLGNSNPEAQLDLWGGSGNQMRAKLNATDFPDLRFVRWHDPSSSRGGRQQKVLRAVASITLMGIAGLRVGEVTRLRLCDITLQSDRVEIRVRGKGDRIRLVAMAGKNASPIRAWATTRGSGNSGEPWLVARAGEDRGMTVASIDYVVRKNAAAAQLENVHAHCLRHTAASLALSHGANLVQVRDMLGHGSIVTTSKYLHATGSAITTVTMR
jgi:Phage integrase family